MQNNHKNTPANVLWNCIEHPASIPILVCCLGILYVLTLVEGQDWSGDFSQYIHHAKNLAEGRHYLDTGYLINSASRFVGPYAYPPVYPVLLVPVYWLFGIDLEAMKWVGIICFCLALLLIGRSFNYRFEKTYIFTLIFLVALNPYIWQFSNYIGSDFTFILFCYLSLCLMLWVFQHDKDKASKKTSITFGLLIGLSVYLAYGTREIGIVMPLTLLAYEIIIKRRISLLTITAISIFTILFYLQKSWLSGTFIPENIQENLRTITDNNSNPVEISHMNFIDLDPGNILNRIRGYRWALQKFWPETSYQLVNLSNAFLFNITTLLAFIGYVFSIFRKITVLEIFLAGYIMTLLLFGAPPTVRYLVPLIPLLFYYLFIACKYLIFPWLKSIRLKYMLIGTYLVLTGFIYYFPMQEVTYDQLEKGVTHPQAKEMFAFISDHTDINDTLVFRKPRIMSLQTGRTTATWPNSGSKSPQFMNRFFDALEADYYVDMNLETWMKPLQESSPPSDRFSEVFRNNYFVIYRYNPVQS